MKKISYLIIIVSSFFISVTALAADDIYARYQYLLKNMSNEQSISQFIKQDNYLSDRLQKKWLAYLAKHKRWQDYLDFYTATNNKTRKCHYLHALYSTDSKQLALKNVKKLWLSPYNSPKACNYIFKKWLAQQTNKRQLRWQRIELSIKNKQYKFAKKLSQQLSTSDRKLVYKWLKLNKKPHLLVKHQFKEHPYNNVIIINVLKKLIVKNQQQAINYWNSIKNDYGFTNKQKQSLYQRLALFSAMRDRDDAEFYFAKLDPSTTPDLYHEWRIRAALKQQRWQDVNNIITSLPSHLHAKPSWQYWYARSFEKLGFNDTAQGLYSQLSEKRNYYGFLASHRSALPMNMQQEIYQEQTQLLDLHEEQIKNINNLYIQQKYSKASLLSYELANDLSKAGQYQLAKRYATWQWHDKALMLTNLSQYKNDLSLRFPLAHYKLVEKYSEKYNVEEAFIYAIIRQESTFRKKVRSSAGALGLMQVIPSTARIISRKYNIRLRNMKKMYKPKTNLNIGTAYLSHLAKRFNNHPVLIAAAYNAGPRQVNKWLKTLPNRETDLWIETLPWHETRNYLKNIMAFYAVYQYRLNETPDVQIFMDKVKGNK